MSNHKFIQVDPPKEELTLPASMVDFIISSDTKSEETVAFTFTSTVSTFTGVNIGDFLQMSFANPDTFVETFMGIVEVASVASVNEITTSVLSTEVFLERKAIDAMAEFRGKQVPKLYKLPTNNFSLQVKTDSIVRYYEDPVDKTIMYLDVIDSASICGHGTGACTEVWGHDRASLGIVTLNNTNRTPMHNIVPYLNSIFLGADDEN
tara:strand:- start:1104 stop:1724 length:621 start_codon:yes stop_codon:yes gene_type:complete